MNQSEKQNIAYTLSAKVQYLDVKEDTRVFVVSDIHGQGDALESLLQEADFKSTDILVIVGDMVEKGGNSLKTLQTIIHLSSKGNVYPLLGNVDYWKYAQFLSNEKKVHEDILRYSFYQIEHGYASLFYEMCEGLSISYTREMDVQSALQKIRVHFKNVFDFLSSLPAILVTKHKIFVHGGLKTEDVESYQGSFLPDILKWDGFLHDAPCFHKMLIVGHYPATLYHENFPDFAPFYSKEKNVLSIDGGVSIKQEGQLNLLVFEHEKEAQYTLYFKDFLKNITCLENQNASITSHYINWENRFVKVLLESEISCLIEHQGEKISVPKDFVYTENGKTACMDFTDYLLPIQKNEHVHLIKAYPFGAYVKKGCIAGWYMGKYVE